METKIKIGIYYVANVTIGKQNPKQLLIQGVYIDAQKDFSFEEINSMPIGSLWNKSSIGPKNEYDLKSLAGKVLLIEALNTWDDNGKQRFSVVWNALSVSQTIFEEDLALYYDTIVLESMDAENAQGEFSENVDFELEG